jgi:hypothetical protein
VSEIAPRRIGSRFTGSKGALIACALLALAIVAYIALGSGASGDYSTRAPVAGDNAGPALDALIHGHLGRFVTHQPLMGLSSLLLRAPVAGLGVLMGADRGLVYGLGALVCLLPLALLSAWMVGRPGAPEQRLGAVFAAGILLIGPATVAAVHVGHPEEVLAAALATGAVVAASRHRPGWAWPMLGLAVGTKQWALLAAPCVLLALPDRRVVTGLKAGALALVLSATLPLADPAAFARADSVVGGLRFTDPFSLWWPLGTPISAPAHASFLPTAHLLPFALPRSAAAGAGLMLALAALWLYCSRRADLKTPIDPLALLALLGLFRCITDPDPLQYNFVALLIPLAAWEVVGLRRLPLATAVAAGAAAAVARGSEALSAGAGLHLTPSLLSALSIAWTVPLACYLARRVVHAPALFASSRPGAMAFGQARRSG